LCDPFYRGSGGGNRRLVTRGREGGHRTKKKEPRFLRKRRIIKSYIGWGELNRAGKRWARIFPSGRETSTPDKKHHSQEISHTPRVWGKEQERHLRGNRHPGLQRGRAGGCTPIHEASPSLGKKKKRDWERKVERGKEGGGGHTLFSSKDLLLKLRAENGYGSRRGPRRKGEALIEDARSVLHSERKGGIGTLIACYLESGLTTRNKEKERGVRHSLIRGGSNISCQTWVKETALLKGPFRK